MLKPPPPDRKSLDRGALEGEGKSRYLRSLEKKLDKLQGSDKRSITSRDIMSSLNEARDDHLGQDRWEGSVSTTDNADLHSASDLTPSVEGTNDPWQPSVTPTSSDDTSQHHTAASDTDPSEVFVVDMELDKSGCGGRFLSSLTCCYSSSGSGSRMRLRGGTGRSSLTDDEERQCLMESEGIWDAEL